MKRSGGRPPKVGTSVEETDHVLTGLESFSPVYVANLGSIFGYLSELALEATDAFTIHHILGEPIIDKNIHPQGLVV